MRCSTVRARARRLFSVPSSIATGLLLMLPLSAAADTARLAQLRIRERVVIRVPRMGPAPVGGRILPASPIEWREKKGPKCIASASLAGALIARRGAIDLVVGGGARYRAVLGDKCPMIGFYSDFYLKRTPDGMICADRDAIRSRSGRACPIERFRALEAKRQRPPRD